MKQLQREPYLALCGDISDTDVFPCLCSFCRFAEWEGDCKEGGYPTCTHRLADMIEGDKCFESAWERQADCWMFRPEVAPDVAADIVGIWLRGKRVDWDTVPLLGKAPK